MELDVAEPLEIVEANWLPIVRRYIRRIGLEETIERLVPSQMHVSIGQIVSGMVLDALSGRTPLFRLQESFGPLERELFFGREVPAEIFSDHNVGRALDRIHEAGASQIFSEVSLRAANAFCVDASRVHGDTTSFSVFGDYDWPEPWLQIEHGHSKDKRRDLKQFVVSMLCVEGAVPVFGKTENGSASDKTINNRLLTDISRHMARHGIGEGAFVYVADSALVTGPNLKKMADIRFLSRLPANFSECGRAIRDAVAAGRWIDLGPLNEEGASAKRPAARYKVHESGVTIDGESYRAVVVHSSAHDRRRRKRLDRAVAKERKELEKLDREVRANPFHCRADAEKEAERLSRRGTFHRVRAEIAEIHRHGRGRPPKDRPREPAWIEHSLSLRIEEDPGKMERPLMEAGCFVLITNVPETAEEIGSPEGLLRLYKDQIGIERNFGFLKDPAIVNAIFLKNPGRIEALGLVLLIALLIWRLIERDLRRHVEETGETLPGWDGRRTRRPTAFMTTTKFIKIYLVKTGEGWRLAAPLTKPQLEYLKALGLTPRVFTDP